MDTTQYPSATKEVVIIKPKGEGRVYSKDIPMYPASAERECRRVARAYYKVFYKCLREYLPDIMRAYAGDIRMDANGEIIPFSVFMQKRMDRMIKELTRALEHFHMTDALEKISKMTRKRNVEEWARAVKKAIGIDISKSYYEQGIFEQVRQLWMNELIAASQNFVFENLSELNAIISDGYRNGLSQDEVKELCRKHYEQSKSWFESMTSDRVSTLNSELTKAEHTDAGVKFYVWKSQHDNRVRQSHRSFDGKIFSWDAPPDGWYVTKSKGLVLTGRRCHPGEDYGCRCCAIPIFDYESMNLPVERSATDEKLRTVTRLHSIPRR